MQLVRRAPGLFGHSQSRWTLATLRESCTWLTPLSLGGVWQILKRLKVVYKRARSYLHSPDEQYAAKLQRIQEIVERVRLAPETYVLLYLDEFTYYRQPTLASAYELTGHPQPLARWSYRSNCHFRILSALNGLTGKLTYTQDGRIGVQQFTHFLSQLRAEYPWAVEIFIVLDNWPVHFHPNVLAALEPQRFLSLSSLPPKWTSSPSRPQPEVLLPIQFVNLPTYASWLNPIEKLWRWLKQNRLHLHLLADDWQALKLAVASSLDQFLTPSPELLRYVGLLPD